MLFRPYRNDDTPTLVEVWRSQPAYRGLMHPMSAGIFERYVLSKLYFDRQGLILAEENGRVQGFVHAGFGPNADGSWAGSESGVLSMILISASYSERESLAEQLLAAGEQYLRDRGARVLFGGGDYPHSPFYLGLYGSSHLPGILVSDQWHVQLFSRAGYQSVRNYTILQCKLVDFRPVINRQQLQIRRRTRLDWVIDPRSENWWEANLTSQHDFTAYRLLALDNQALWASAVFWDMEPLASSWGVHAAGLLHYERTSACAESGAETFLLSEALKHLQNSGVTLVEALVRDDDNPRLQLITDLGFKRIDEGVVFAKE